MELRHLRYFVTVAETANFTRAAEILHTVQPSLSRQIQDLEREIGAMLLQRNSRKIELTPAGVVFLDEARLVLAQAERAVERARQVARASAGRLTLGFLPGVEIDLLVGVMTALHGELKDVELTMHSQPSPDLIRSLHARRIDAAFIRPDDDCEGLEVRILRREHLLAAVPAGHRLAKATSIKPTDFNKQPFIAVAAERAPVLATVIQEFTRKHNIVASECYEAENLAMAFSLIASIDGLSLLPEYAFRLCPPSVVAVPLASTAPMIDLALASHPGNRSSVLNAFIRYFSESAEPGANQRDRIERSP
jgi:LysR family hca operon transcriptional activator